MSRIQLTDHPISIMGKMSDGNPGALLAVCEVIKNGATIDPQDIMGGLGAILLLDSWEIYGPDIYILYNDQCKRNVRSLIMLLRACQLGLLERSKLKQIAGDQSRQFLLSETEMDKLDERVCSELKMFVPKPNIAGLTA